MADLLFKTPKELKDKIDLYFESCFDIDETGNKTKIKPYTILGLCNYLDIDRKTLLNYVSRAEEGLIDSEFSTLIKKRKSRVEEDIELGALTNKLNPTVAIFNLKNNFNWKDKTEVDNTNTNLEVKDDNLTEAQRKIISQRYGNN